MVKVDEVYDLLEELSYEELRKVNSYCVDLLETERKKRAMRNMREFEVGDEVEVVEDGEISLVGKITKKFRTRMTVQEEDSGKKWRVPANMLRHKNGEQG